MTTTPNTPSFGGNGRMKIIRSADPMPGYVHFPHPDIGTWQFGTMPFIAPRIRVGQGGALILPGAQDRAQMVILGEATFYIEQRDAAVNEILVKAARIVGEYRAANPPGHGEAIDVLEIVNGIYSALVGGFEGRRVRAVAFAREPGTGCIVGVAEWEGGVEEAGGEGETAL